MTNVTRRDLFIGGSAVGVAALGAAVVAAAPRDVVATGPHAGDRVFICNEDSNTMTVIDPVVNMVEATINLTSFDEDSRPPFRFATGGIVPTHGAMIQKPLYRGAISIHGAAPSPNNRLLAVTGRGSSNVYLIDTAALRVVNNFPNPLAAQGGSRERLSAGILLGREPHEPTFTRDGAELWVAIRGGHRLAMIDIARATSPDEAERRRAITGYVDTIDGPAQVWFSNDGRRAFVCSQKRAVLDVFDLSPGEAPRRRTTLELGDQDPYGFTPFQKTSPDGGELWLSHKLADRVACIETGGSFRTTDRVDLGEGARPNHLEFVENTGGRVVYVSLARVDDRDGGAASSQIAVIDRSATAGTRKVVGSFFSAGREAHGLWVDPSNTRLYVAHEGDELPGTEHGGETICSVFDVARPLSPRLVARVPVGYLALPSGRLRNKKSINLVYVRPGAQSQVA